MYYLVLLHWLGLKCNAAEQQIVSILALFPVTNISTLSIMFVPFVLYQVKEIPFISSCKGIVIFFKKNHKLMLKFIRFFFLDHILPGSVIQKLYYTEL